MYHMGMDFRKIIFFFSIFEGLNAPSYQRQFSFNSQLLFGCLSSSFIRDTQTKLMPMFYVGRIHLNYLGKNFSKRM